MGPWPTGLLASRRWCHVRRWNDDSFVSSAWYSGGACSRLVSAGRWESRWRGPYPWVHSMAHYKSAYVEGTCSRGSRWKEDCRGEFREHIWGSRPDIHPTVCKLRKCKLPEGKSCWSGGATRRDKDHDTFAPHWALQVSFASVLSQRCKWHWRWSQRFWVIECASLNASFCTPFNVLAPFATFDRTFLPGLLDTVIPFCAAIQPSIAQELLKQVSLLQSHWSDYNIYSIYSQNTVVRPVRLVPEMFAIVCIRRVSACKKTIENSAHSTRGFQRCKLPAWQLQHRWSQPHPESGQHGVLDARQDAGWSGLSCAVWPRATVWSAARKCHLVRSRVWVLWFNDVSTDSTDS